MACLVRTINGMGDHRFAAQVQARDLRGDFGNAGVVLRQIVDEQRAGGRIFVDDRRQRRALGPLIGKYPRIYPDLGQLLRARIAVMIGEIGEDHHIGLFGQCVDAFDRAGDVPNCSVTSYEYDPQLGKGGHLALRLVNFVAPLEATGTPVTAGKDLPAAPKA